MSKETIIRAAVITLSAFGVIGGMYGFVVKHDPVGLVYCAMSGLIIGIAWRVGRRR